MFTDYVKVFLFAINRRPSGSGDGGERWWQVAVFGNDERGRPAYLSHRRRNMYFTACCCFSWENVLHWTDVRLGPSFDLV